MMLTQPRDPLIHPPVMQDETYVELDMPKFSVVAAAMEGVPAHVLMWSSLDM